MRNQVPAGGGRNPLWGHNVVHPGQVPGPGPVGTHHGPRELVRVWRVRRLLQDLRGRGAVQGEAM